MPQKDTLEGILKPCKDCGSLKNYVKDNGFCVKCDWERRSENNVGNWKDAKPYNHAHRKSHKWTSSKLVI